MATREDASLLLQVLRWGAESGLDESMRAIFAPTFDPAANPMDDPHVGRVLAYCETVGTLVKHGLLDRELVVDLIWVEGLWARVGRAGLAIREAANEPRLYENFEALVVGSMAASAA